MDVQEHNRTVIDRCLYSCEPVRDVVPGDVELLDTTLFLVISKCVTPAPTLTARNVGEWFVIIELNLDLENTFESNYNSFEQMKVLR